ncbi:HTH_Tnp_Tc3_2 domain-containing protein [Trichonephila clavipes]|nr:HTH_Tnp_Tc3_2 domain-containing protein [Trichonephila clavipes]
MLSSRPGAIYQQDNARPHTARLSQQCLQGYNVLPWPARSPDLSPIEHVWTRWEGGMPHSLRNTVVESDECHVSRYPIINRVFSIGERSREQAGMLFGGRNMWWSLILLTPSSLIGLMGKEVSKSQVCSSGCIPVPAMHTREVQEGNPIPSQTIIPGARLGTMHKKTV